MVKDDRQTMVQVQQQETNFMARSSLCMPLYNGDNNVDNSHRSPEPTPGLRQFFNIAESNALERLVSLKAKLQTISTNDFWEVVAEEISNILGSQCTFISKRMLVDEHDAAIEMPPLGEPGSCLMGVALYIDNGKDFRNMYRNYQYQAYCTPCAFMKHEKVLVIPENLTEIVPNNPNKFPWKRNEAYIGVPLFDEGKCFGHFGTMWSDEGAAKRQLSWGFIEMFMHSLEDMITRRLVEGKGFSKDGSSSENSMAVPLSAISASQSLKPYARSLSHELRTPMHGVVGMLDIMSATVAEAMAGHRDPATKGIFEELRKNIDVVQESSKRAVEAADNVVHAYDLGMQMPATPLKSDDIDPMTSVEPVRAATSSPSTLSAVTTPNYECMMPNLPPAFTPVMPSNAKRNRDSIGDSDLPRKRVVMERRSNLEPDSSSSPPSASTSPRLSRSPERCGSELTPTVNTKEFLLKVITDAVESDHSEEKSHQVENGDEVFEILRRDVSEGQSRIIRLSIDGELPDIIEFEEQHLRFSLIKVIHNAIKFTESGSINIHATLSRSNDLIEFRIVDTGRGIDKESQLHLFKPHFQSDQSTVRQKEGLGLSLFNARAYVRKHLGGDITLERSDTDGPYRGSEFLVRFPLDPRSAIRATSPSNTPISRPAPTPLQAITPAPIPPPSPALSSPGTPLRGKLTRLSRAPVRAAVARPATMRVSFNTNLAKDIPLEIMVAEDNVINRNILIGYLKKLGYSEKNITQACDGLEAVRKYEESLKRPSSNRIKAILMDLWMPNMDGYTATEEILKLAATHGENLSIIAVTADITGQSQERAKISGMTGFISKPYKVMDIQNIISLIFKATNDAAKV